MHHFLFLYRPAWWLIGRACQWDPMGTTCTLPIMDYIIVSKLLSTCLIHELFCQPSKLLNWVLQSVWWVLPGFAKLMKYVFNLLSCQVQLKSGFSALHGVLKTGIIGRSYTDISLRREFDGCQLCCRLDEDDGETMQVWYLSMCWGYMDLMCWWGCCSFYPCVAYMDLMCWWACCSFYPCVAMCGWGEGTIKQFIFDNLLDEWKQNRLV